MKLKSGFVLHTVGGDHVAVPVNERTKDFHGMIRLNSSGAYLWEIMQAQGDFTNDTLTAALLEHYEVTEDVAAQTVEAFVAALIDGGLIET